MRLVKTPMAGIMVDQYFVRGGKVYLHCPYCIARLVAESWKDVEETRNISTAIVGICYQVVLDGKDVSMFGKIKIGKLFFYKGKLYRKINKTQGVTKTYETSQWSTFNEKDNVHLCPS